MYMCKWVCSSDAHSSCSWPIIRDFWKLWHYQTKHFLPSRLPKLLLKSGPLFISLGRRWCTNLPTFVIWLVNYGNWPRSKSAVLVWIMAAVFNVMRRLWSLHCWPKSSDSIGGRILFITLRKIVVSNWMNAKLGSKNGKIQTFE